MKSTPCPVCSKPIPKQHEFTCPACWWKLNAQDRVALGNMSKRGQDTTAKLASAVRKLKEKQAREN